MTKPHTKPQLGFDDSTSSAESGCFSSEKDTERIARVDDVPSLEEKLLMAESLKVTNSMAGSPETVSSPSSEKGTNENHAAQSDTAQVSFADEDDDDDSVIALLVEKHNIANGTCYGEETKTEELDVTHEKLKDRRKGKPKRIQIILGPSL